MAYSTKVIAKPSLAKMMVDKFLEMRHKRGVFYSQNSYADQELGMTPQSFSRYANGYNPTSGKYTVEEITMSMDQAAIILSYYGLDAVEHFTYSRASSMSYTQAISIALTAQDQNIAKTLEALAKMKPAQRRAVSEAILRMANGETEEVTGNNLSAA
jgi:hypothetical protein